MAAFSLEDSFTGEFGVRATEEGGDKTSALLSPTRHYTSHIYRP